MRGCFLTVGACDGYPCSPGPAVTTRRSVGESRAGPYAHTLARSVVGTAPRRVVCMRRWHADIAPEELIVSGPRDE